MNVELPSTGCNIINSSTSFYNYSTDSKTRETYVIYDGKAILQSSNYNQYGYTYSGDCLVTGDMVYRPELSIYFQFISGVIIGATLYLIYKIMLERFLGYGRI